MTTNTDVIFVSKHQDKKLKETFPLDQQVRFGSHFLLQMVFTTFFF